MKRFQLGLAAIVSVFFLVSCQDYEQESLSVNEIAPPLKIDGFDTSVTPMLTDFDEVSPSNYPVLDTFVSSTEYSNFLSNYSFSADEYYKLEADSIYSFYGVKLIKQGVATNKEFYLVIYPENGQYTTLLFEQQDYSSYFRIAVYETSNYSLVVSGDFLDGEVEPSAILTCDESTDGFSDCMDCAFDVLTDDWISTAACMVAPWSCIAAATIHCM